MFYSAYCVGCLGLMSDFGTALIFFVAFLAITFLRSGDLASVLLMVLAAFSAGYIVLQFKSYILSRFSIYRHVWDDPSNLGYQQTRTMSAMANGGLFGKGVGNGWLKHVGAANTDLVFGVISEEMGLILAVTAVAAIVVMALFAVREASAARSSFYVITACSAAMIFVVQAMLNVFGSTDLLPLTGVTLPFVSVGGSSMISCWSLLAFINASDTRQNAALSVRLPRKKKKGESDEPESWRTATGFFAVPHEEPELGDEGSETVKFRPVDLETMEQNAPEGAAPQDEEQLPPLDVEEGSSDADNWREYFLKDEDWGDER
jgi:cell division protein FtsW (lipid II flippase)